MHTNMAKQSGSTRRITVDIRDYRDEILEVAALRAAHPGNFRAVMCGHSSETAHILGAYGEAAAALNYGVYDEWKDSLVYGRGDDGHDLVIHSFTVQVKAVGGWVYRPRLILDRDLKHHADVYMLVSVSPVKQAAELVGWLWTPELLNMPTTAMRGVECHVAQEYELHPCTNGGRALQ